MPVGGAKPSVLDDDAARSGFAFAGTLVVHGLLALIILLSQSWLPPKPPPVQAKEKDKYAQLKAIRETVELPKPKPPPPPPPKKEEEPPPPEKKEEPPPPEKKEPPKAKKKKKPNKKLVKKRGQPKETKPKDPPKEPPPPEQKAEPAPLVLENVNLTGGVAVQKGDQDLFGDPSVAANDRNTNVQKVDDPDDYGDDDGVEGGKGTGPPKLVPPKSKSSNKRLRGKYPDDAPRMSRTVSVVLSVRLNTEGKPKSVKVVKGAGPAFDREAKKIGRKLRFEPARRGDVAIEYTVRWTVDFDPNT